MALRPQITSEAAGLAILRLLRSSAQEAGGRHVNRFLWDGLRKAGMKQEDFDRGLQLALEKGWMTKSGMTVTLTEEGTLVRLTNY